VLGRAGHPVVRRDVPETDRQRSVVDAPAVELDRACRRIDRFDLARPYGHRAVVEDRRERDGPRTRVAPRAGESADLVELRAEHVHGMPIDEHDRPAAASAPGHALGEREPGIPGA